MGRIFAVVLGLLISACGGNDETPEVGAAPPVLTAIAVSPSNAIVGVGLTTTVTAEARDQNGVVMSGVAFTWASSNGGIGSVAGGVATGMAAGTTDITASSGGVSSNPVRLTVVAVNQSSVVVDKASVFFTGAGESAQLAAQPFNATGAPSGGAVTWTSSAPDKVSVDAGGHLVAMGIGSALIFAESAGVKSAPTLVIVARPQAGALLVADAQVVSVGAPLLVAGVAQYEVTLRGVTAPLPGTVLLAGETAPVAGKVVATRTGAAGLVVTLALTPLHQLFEAYDIRVSMPLSAFAFEEVPDRAAMKAQRIVWGEGSGRPRVLAAVRPLDSTLDPFKVFKCDASLEPQLAGKTVSLSLTNNLNLVLEDRPGYSKHALEGSLDIVANAGLKLKAGFKAKGDCKAQGQLKMAVLGWVSVLIMPAVRGGVGAEIEGEILLVQGELAVEGKVGFAGSLGWECGGATPACRGLDSVTPVYDLKTKSKIPSANDMQVKVSGQFYIVTGLDAAIFLGALNAEIVEARIGPKQSFDLGFEDDQAARPDYAASYDLKLEGIIEPGSALQKAIKAVIDDDGTGVTFEAKFNKDLSESPKGTFSIDKPKVRPDAPVNFTVDLDQKTVSYFLLDYNVVSVELWRKREDEPEFKTWKTMDLIATNKATYRWTPTKEDAGKYEFAAFVNTKVPFTLLEINPNSIRPLEVACFAGPPAAMGAARSRAAGIAQQDGKGPLAAACADVWTGSASVIGRTPGSPPSDNITSRSNVTWTFDHVDQGGNIIYLPTGSFDLAFNFTSFGCSTSLAPNHFVITPDAMQQARLFITGKNPLIPQTYGIVGRQFVTFTSTTSCPGKPDTVTLVNNYLVDYASGSGPYNDQVTLTGTYEDLQFTNTWSFSRP